MSTDRRWPPLAAVAALLLQSAASAFAYAPRLAPPGIPSSPPREVVASARPFGELRFTLNPRMGFFAAGDPINGMDPDGRVSTATLNSFTYGAIGGLASLDAQYTIFASKVGLLPKPLATVRLTADFMMMDSAAQLTSSLNQLTGANPDSTAYKIGSFIPAIAAAPQLVRAGLPALQKGWSALAERLPTLADDIATKVDDLFPSFKWGGPATNPSKAGALFPPGPPKTALNAENLKLSQTVANHRTDVVKSGVNKGELARPYLNSTLTTREIMAAKPPIPDPGGVPGALRWDVPGQFRGSSGTWQLVVDPKTETILHYNFVTPK